MKKSRIILYAGLIGILISPGFSGQNKSDRTPEERSIPAVRLDQRVEIDGRLKEPVWQREGTGGFIQSDPIDGAEPTEKTLVWVAYDRDALYVAARMFDSKPGHITSRLGRRDIHLRQ